MDKPLHSCCCLASRSETLVRWDTKLAETIQTAIHKITNPLKKTPHKIFIFWALVLKLKSKFPLEKVFWEFSRNRETFGNTSTPCLPSTPHPPPPKKRGRERWGSGEREKDRFTIMKSFPCIRVSLESDGHNPWLVLKSSWEDQGAENKHRRLRRDSSLQKSNSSYFY